MPSISTTNRINVERQLQSRLMQLQIWYNQLYTRMIKFANRIGGGQVKEDSILPMGAGTELSNVRGADGIINVFEDFKESGTDLQIPIKRRKHGWFVHGDDTLQGKGADSEWVYQTLRVAAVADAINTKRGHFSEQTYKRYKQAIDNARPELGERLSRYINNAMIKYALAYGASYELLRTTANGGRGLSAISHPNMYVAGVGWVSYDLATDVYTNLPGTANYEIDVETAINSSGTTSAYQMSTDLVDKMAMYAPMKRIDQPIIIAGNPYYIWVVGSQSKYQLFNDTKFRSLAETVIPREQDPMKNMLINAALCAYKGFLFVEDNQCYGAHTNANANGWLTAPSAGTLGYGPEIISTSATFGIIKNRDNSRKQLSYILGKGALNLGIAKQVEITDENWDHKRKSEMGSNWIAGCELANQFDSDNFLGNGAGAFAENTGSIAIITDSPLS